MLLLENNGLFVHGNTLYIAGTKSAGDVYDDLKMPCDLTSFAQRDKDAEI